MKCKSCDCFLTEYENSRKSLVTGEYIELCEQCFVSIKNECLAFGNPALLGDGEEHEFQHLDIDNLFDEDTDEWNSR